MSKKTALGKGMDGLLPIGFDVTSVAEPGEKVILLKLEDIISNPDQPRKLFDDALLEELTESIKEHGVIQPIIVSQKNKMGKHEIIAGERRWRASKKASLQSIPSIIRNTKEQQKLEIAIIENVQRVDLSPLEEAMSIYRLKQEFNLTLDDIAKKLGKAKTTISNTMRLLHLPNEVKEALSNNIITEGHARAILSLTDEKEQIKLLNKIVTHKLSVRQTEAEAKSSKVVLPSSRTEVFRRNKVLVSPALKKRIVHLSSSLKTHISYNESKSQLTITIDSEDKLKEIVSLLDI